MTLKIQIGAVLMKLSSQTHYFKVSSAFTLCHTLYNHTCKRTQSTANNVI